MSDEALRPHQATETGTAEPSALEKPTTAEVERARREFYEVFDSHCRTPLSADAERRLGEIFAMTVVHGLHRRPGGWDRFREFALRHVASIGDRAHRGATNNLVTRPVLVRHADDVVRAGAAECDALLSARSSAAPLRVFCEDYVFETEAESVANAASVEVDGGDGTTAHS